MALLNSHRPPVERRPPIVIRTRDANTLQAIALGGLLRWPRPAGALLDELHRAQVRPDDQVPHDVIGLGSEVTFVVDGAANQPDQVQLVIPIDAAPGEGRISVLSSLGAGLLGLRTGQVIDWPDRRGGVQRLVVVAVQTPTPGQQMIGYSRRAPTPADPLRRTRK